MSLVRCKECGKEVSSVAPTCPSCGAPVRRRAKWPWLLVAGLLIIGLSVSGYQGAAERAKDTDAIKQCWMTRSAGQATADRCHSMEAEFRQKHGRDSGVVP